MWIFYSFINSIYKKSIYKTVEQIKLKSIIFGRLKFKKNYKFYKFYNLYKRTNEKFNLFTSIEIQIIFTHNLKKIGYIRSVVILGNELLLYMKYYYYNELLLYMKDDFS